MLSWGNETTWPSPFVCKQHPRTCTHKERVKNFGPTPWKKERRDPFSGRGFPCLKMKPPKTGHFWKNEKKPIKWRFHFKTPGPPVKKKGPSSFFSRSRSDFLFSKRKTMECGLHKTKGIMHHRGRVIANKIREIVVPRRFNPGGRIYLEYHMRKVKQDEKASNNNNKGSREKQNDKR